MRDCGERTTFAEEDTLSGRMALLWGPALRLRGEPADIPLERTSPSSLIDGFDVIPLKPLSQKAGKFATGLGPRGMSPGASRTEPYIRLNR